MLKHVLAGLVLASSVGHSPLFAQTPAAQPAAAPATDTKVDYSDDKSWLCKHGRHDACDVDLNTTVVAADGKLTLTTWTPRGPPA